MNFLPRGAMPCASYLKRLSSLGSVYPVEMDRNGMNHWYQIVRKTPGDCGGHLPVTEQHRSVPVSFDKKASTAVRLC